MRLSDVAHYLNAALYGPDRHFSSMALDSRSTEKGQLFAAIKGHRTDGHQHIGQAIENGAVAALVETLQPFQVTQILVDDVIEALWHMGHMYRNMIDIPVVAVTGSFGKTTTKGLIASILQQNGRVLASERSFNTALGLPVTLSHWDRQDYAVFEVGANQKGEIKDLCNMLRPDIGIINNIGHAHLEGFGGSLADVADAKSELFDGLSANGTAIINADAPYAGECVNRARDRRVVRYGLHQPAEITAENVEFNDQGQPRFILKTPNDSQTIQLSLAGEHQVNNALAAAAVAYCLNISLAKAAEGLSQVRPPEHRMTVKSGPGASQIIDDCYNANPESTQAALKFLARFSGKRIAVLGDMKELGDDNGSALHRQIGAFAGSLGIDELFTIGEYADQIAQDFAGSSVFTDKNSLYNALVDKLSGSTTVLIKASRSLHLETLVYQLLDQRTSPQS